MQWAAREAEKVNKGWAEAVQKDTRAELRERQFGEEEWLELSVQRKGCVCNV